MQSLVLLLALYGGDDGFRWPAAESPSFTWPASELKGGDQPAVVEEQDAPSPGSGADGPLVESAPEPSTAICPCLGYRGRAHCYCLQRGVACRCNRTTGSEWLMKNGRPVKKTGRYADPRGANAIARRDAPAASAPQDDAAPRQRADGKWWWKGPQGDNGEWWSIASAPVEGQTYVYGTNRFVYRGGKMVPGSQMAADITPNGHFEIRRVCRGSYCENVRVWVKD